MTARGRGGGRHGSGVKGGAGLWGPHVRGESTAQARGLLPPLPSSPCPCLSRAGSGLGGTCSRGPGGRQGPLGFIQVAFRSRPVRGGAHGTQSSTHRAPPPPPPPGAPHWSAVTSPLCQQSPAFGVYGAGPNCWASALRPTPGPHTGPLFWGLGRGGEVGPQHSGTVCSSTRPGVPASPQKAWGATGLASTSWSLRERSGGPGVQACGFGGHSTASVEPLGLSAVEGPLVGPAPKTSAKAEGLPVLPLSSC